MKVRDIAVKPVGIEKSDKLSHAMDLMEKYDTRRLLVTNGGAVHGIVTMRSITRALGTWKKSSLPTSSMHVVTAATGVYTKVLPDMDFNDAVALMDSKGGVLLASDNSTIVGWVTPQEILSHAKNVKGFAGEVIREPVTASTGDRVVHIRRLMLDKNVGRVPVMDGLSLVGIVTEKDIAKAMRAFRDMVSGNQQESRIKNLIVEDIMSKNVKYVMTNTPLTEVVELMLRENIGGVPVLNLKEELVGMISRRSIISMLARKG